NAVMTSQTSTPPPSPPAVVPHSPQHLVTKAETTPTEKPLPRRPIGSPDDQVQTGLEYASRPRPAADRQQFTASKLMKPKTGRIRRHLPWLAMSLRTWYSCLDSRFWPSLKTFFSRLPHAAPSPVARALAAASPISSAKGPVPADATIAAAPPT